MNKNAKVLEEIKDQEWLNLLKELLEAGITKDQFKDFIKLKRQEKNLSQEIQR